MNKSEPVEAPIEESDRCLHVNFNQTWKSFVILPTLENSDRKENTGIDLAIFQKTVKQKEVRCF
ncbi:MAG: hypothetical protein KME59_21060 [Trichormus sp. ATA11-4-KO1]|nr:hypothetical protein [Trichormus sp. ATA11-4-KO1]